MCKSCVALINEEELSDGIRRETKGLCDEIAEKTDILKAQLPPNQKKLLNELLDLHVIETGEVQKLTVARMKSACSGTT